MRQLASTSKERPAPKAVVFLTYDLILIVLAYFIPDLWMRLLCILLFALAAIRAITLFVEAILSSDIIEGEFGLRLDESQD